MRENYGKCEKIEGWVQNICYSELDDDDDDDFTKFILSEAEFKEFEPRLKFKLRLKYSWFHLKSCSLFQDLSRRSIETGFWRI